MFTAKDLEVYKDSIKEKKNKAIKAGDKPLITHPSAVKISKAPSSKLQNEEPLKERKPLSVVHKASNTIKDPHKPPSSAPVGTSMLKISGGKNKDISSPLEANTFVKVSDVKREPLKSPRETSLPKPSHNRSEDNNAVGVRTKVKEPSTHGTHSSKSPSMSAAKVSPPANVTAGVYQKSFSMSAAKVAPPVNVNSSLCSECARAASEGAVCFIGNDGRVSACTTRSAVRLCKNLNCAANNPEYVAAMANAPKKYLISKRHSLKAQFGIKGKSGRPKSPIAQQGGVAGVNTSGSVSPSNGDTSHSMHDVNTDSSVLAPEDGALTSLNGNLRLFDGDMSLLDEADIFCGGEMGLMNDVTRGMPYMEDFVAAEEGSSEGTDANEQKNISFYQVEVGGTESPKFSTSDLLQEHINALSEGKEYNDRKSNADEESSKLQNLEELGDADADETLIYKNSDPDSPKVKADEGTNLPSFLGEEAYTNAQSVSVDSLIDVSQPDGDINQISDRRPPTDVEQGADDGQAAGNKLEEEQRHNLISCDIKQVNEDVAPVTNTIQPTYKDSENADSMPINSSDPLGVQNDASSAIEVDLAEAQSNQDRGIESNIHCRQNGDIIPFLPRHVADHSCGDDIQSPSVGDAQDDMKSLYNDQSDKETTTKVVHSVSGDDDSDVHRISQNTQQHMADVDQCNDITSPHGLPLVDGKFLTPLHVMEAADDDEGDNDRRSLTSTEVVAPTSNSSALLKDIEAEEDGANQGLVPCDESDGKGEGESDEDDNEYETIESEAKVCIADNDRSVDQSTVKSLSGEGDGKVTSGNSMKKHRRRRLVNIVTPPNPEMVILRKQQTQERKQAEKWMLDYAIEGVVHKLAPIGEGKVKILVEAFESIISHTDVDAIESHSESKEKHTLS